MSGYVYRQMIIWTLFLVFGMAGLCGLFLMQPPAGLDPKAVSVLPKGRHPAADLQPEIQTTPLASRTSAQAVTLKLNCRGPHRTEFTPFVTQVRLTVDLCKGQRDSFVKSDIRNLTNGTTATVFWLSDRTFTTDYLSLSAGENRIAIRHEGAEGKLEETEHIIAVVPDDETDLKL